MKEYSFPNQNTVEIQEKIEEILKEENIVDSINANIDQLLIMIPEIKSMIGSEHNHPHHHLDVWQHTLAVIGNLNTKDLELNMAALLHDIGKPFSYQDDEVRHFHGHPEVSHKMALQILTRLGYDEEFISRVLYLVRTHDTIIDTQNLDNELVMVKKRLKLQFADARAHHPDKIKKRINFLRNVDNKLKILESEAR